mgnify:CR=1 FL=1
MDPTPVDAVSAADPTFVPTGDDGWQRLAPAARTVRAITGAVAGAVIAVPLAVVVVTIAAGGGLLWPLLAMPAAVVSGALAGAWIGQARWRRTRWRLDAVGLYVRRGLIWHTEVLVPRSRVQHLDVERGPLERQFGLATLVVHTAGTQTSALRQSGFDEATAVALRDALIPDAARHADAL